MICRELMNDPNLDNLRVGEESAGEFARKQLEAARNDPRVSRDDGRAMMADFWDAMEEAERVRTLTHWSARRSDKGFGTTLTRRAASKGAYNRRLDRKLLLAVVETMKPAAREHVGPASVIPQVCGRRAGDPTVAERSPAPGDA